MAAPSRNLEIKAVDPLPARTLHAALDLGAEDHGTLHQRDTYFHAVIGRLKLREIAGQASELIAYARADRAGPRLSHYRVVPVLDPRGLEDALRDALGVRVVVEKERRLLLWRDVRVHLDRVARLGTFVELEAPAQRDDLVAELRGALDVPDERLVAVGYADLLAPG